MGNDSAIVHLPENLPSIANATLPERYEAAKIALAECARADECQDWADKMAALASYAKQSKDEELERYATKIRGRAIRRCGELLAEIKPAKGGRPTDEKLGRASTLVSEPTRAGAAKDAGLSSHQQKTALRVAAVPEPLFEKAVERERPATVTELARIGTATKPKPLFDLKGRDPKEFQLSTTAQGLLRGLAEFVGHATPAAIARGTMPPERKRMLRELEAIAKWVPLLIQKLEEQNDVK